MRAETTLNPSTIAIRVQGWMKAAFELITLSEQRNGNLTLCLRDRGPRRYIHVVITDESVRVIQHGPHFTKTTETALCPSLKKYVASSKAAGTTGENK